MNKETVLQNLLSILGAVQLFPSFIEEFMGIIALSGYEDKLFKLLITRLRQLAALGLEATRLEEFENLGDGLYSLHLAGKPFNVRILYSFLPNRQPVLLLPFYERGRKKKTDYTSHIPAARGRLEALKEEHYRE